MRFVRLDEERNTVSITVVLPLVRCEKEVPLKDAHVLRVYDVSESYKVVTIEDPFDIGRTFHVIGSPDFVSSIVDRIARRDFESLPNYGKIVKSFFDILVVEKGVGIRQFYCETIDACDIKPLRGLDVEILFENFETAKQFYEAISKDVSARITEDVVRQYVLDLVDRFPNAVTKLETKPLNEVLRGVYLVLYTDHELSTKLTQELFKSMEAPVMGWIEDLEGGKLNDVVGNHILTFAVEKNGEYYVFKDPHIAIGLASLLREPLNLDEKIYEACEYLHPRFVFEVVPTPANRCFYQERFLEIARRVYEEERVDEGTVRALKSTVYPAIGVWDLADGPICGCFDSVVEGLIYLLAFCAKNRGSPLADEVLRLVENVRYLLLKFGYAEEDWYAKIRDAEYLENEARRLAGKDPPKLRSYTEEELFDEDLDEVDNADAETLRELFF